MLVALGLILPGPALAAGGPMITSPADGQAVQLDRNWDWTLNVHLSLPPPPGSFGLQIGDRRMDQATAYQSHAYTPVDNACVSSGDSATEFDCTIDSSFSLQGGKPLDAGTYYLFVSYTDSSGATSFSPLVSFVVPRRLKSGCAPGESSCRGLVVSRGRGEPRPGIRCDRPPDGFGCWEFGVNINVADNIPSSDPYTVRLTIKAGRRVVKRIVATRSYAQGEKPLAPPSFIGWFQGDMFNWLSFHLPGVQPGGRITVTASVSIDGLTVTGTGAGEAP